MKRSSFCLLILSLFIFSRAGAILYAATSRQKNGDSTSVKRKTLSERFQDWFSASNEFREAVNLPTPENIKTFRLPHFSEDRSDLSYNVSFIRVHPLTQKDKNEWQVASRTFQEAARDLEGALFFDQVGNDVDTTFGLRGFAESGAVTVLLDGVRVNELDGDAVNFPLIAMQDVETLQIDRGSASPVYGSGTFAGVVNIRTQKPSPKRFSLFGGTEWSSFGGVRLFDGVSGTIHDSWSPFAGDWTYYFQMGRDLNNGFRRNGEVRITSLNAKLGYELPDHGGGIHVGLKHVRDALSNPGALTVPEFHADPEQTTNPLDGRDFKTTIVQIQTDKKFWENRVIASLAAYWRINLLHFYSTSRTFPDGMFNPDTDLTTVRSRSTDLIWQLSYRDAWGWLANETGLGMTFRNASEHSVEQDAFGGNVVETSPRETERSSRPDYLALFWREQVKFFKRVIFHVGMRHDWHVLKTDDQLMPANNLSRRWRASTVSTGVVVKLMTWWDLFGNYSQGFRVPTISEIAPFSSGIATALEPERTDSYEWGSRIRYQDKAEGKFSFFVIDVKDEILFDSTSVTMATPFGQNINVGKNRRIGIETRLDADPIPELHAYAAYTWTKAYVRESTGSGIPFDGRDLGLVPRHRITAGVSSRLFNRFGMPWDGLVVGVNMVYTGEQFVQSFESSSQAALDAGGSKIDPYLICNGIVSYDWKGLQLYFKIKNIFNKTYYSRGVAATNFGSNNTPAGTHLFVNPGPPREFIVGAKWEI